MRTISRIDLQIWKYAKCGIFIRTIIERDEEMTIVDQVEQKVELAGNKGRFKNVSDSVYVKEGGYIPDAN